MSDPNISGAESNLGSLWQRALDRYREDLREAEDYTLVQQVSSLDELLDYAKNIEPSNRTDPTVIGLPRRLGSALKYVDDFAAVVALSLGANAKLTAIIWGSIRLLLSLASGTVDILKDVLDMLEELSISLPRLKAYENAVPADQPLQESLVDLYTEVICFYARAIHFFHRYSHAWLAKAHLASLRDDFAQTIGRIRRLSSHISVEIETARMRSERIKYEEVLSLMDETSSNSSTRRSFVSQKKQFYWVPVEKSHRFYGREGILEALHNALKPRSTAQLQSCAVHGLGGVGKTEIALQYIGLHRDVFDAVFWVAADNIISIGHSFLEIAKVLELLVGVEDLQDSVGAILKVKDRLRQMNQSWLLVLDNADDLEVLRQIWPVGSRGSILITTRDPNVSQWTTSETIDVQPFDNQVGSKALLERVGIQNASATEETNALLITQALGGLPLAINQIGGFIAQRRLPLQDFLPLYEKNSSKINTRKPSSGSYDRTLSTVWEMAISKLSGHDRQLLNLLPFFHPDEISESILSEGSSLLEDPDFGFLKDMMDLGDAEETLLRYSLIKKTISDANLSVHRLIQAEILVHLDDPEKARNIAIVVKMLTWGFPDTWSQDVGHQGQAWSRCETCLPHVHHLQKLYTQGRISIANRHDFAELLLRCSWYLYEQESYTIAQPMVEAALDLFENRDLAYASAVDLSGLMDLDLNRPQEALNMFRKAHSLRVQLKGPNDPLVASSLNNFALAYTEMDLLSQAYEAHLQAIEIRKVSAYDRIGNSYSNMASLLLKMKKADEAEQMLMQCPSLQNFTDDTFLKTGNPRFSGDMVLLSRIRQQQGRMDDALRLASKALAFRQRVCGNKLKTCDSLYDVACLLHLHGKIASGIDFLRQLIEKATCIPEGNGQLARAYFKLSLLLEKTGHQTEAEECRSKAIEIRAAFKSAAANDPVMEEEFGKLCLWMLW